MKKRIIFLLLTLAMSFSLIACGGQGEDDNNVSKQEEIEDEEEKNTKEADQSEADQGKTDEGEADQGETDEGEAEDEEIQAFKEVDISTEGWEIIIKDVIRQSSLENISVQLGYTDATTNEFVKTASEGYEYFLIKMIINKDGSRETISWSNMILTDDKGNVYKRIDDTFLSDLDLDRMPGTDLNFGSHEGWFAYEVKEEANNLSLGYEFENETLEYEFSGN